ncbi:hypothetical protein VTL71DRAFT_13289 [Oculimacula yallundae]|uniref:PA domain-containing protein n=1 Tax=Oculimacula yallundae TaxID=86028 RepID=A0ABR4CJX3_9HELO
MMSISLSIDGVDIPSGTATCDVTRYAELDVKGKVVLVERGTCPTGGTLAGRVRPAAAAGASVVIVYNNVDAHVIGSMLLKPDPEGFMPAGFINRVDRLKAVKRLETREDVMVKFQMTQLIEMKFTQNIIAETKGGDLNNVIILGAHYKDHCNR